MITCIIIAWILIHLSAPGWTYVLLCVGFLLQLVQWMHHYRETVRRDRDGP